MVDQLLMVLYAADLDYNAGDLDYHVQALVGLQPVLLQQK